MLLSNPVTLGCLMGCLYALAPDHIGTLIALTAGVSSLGRAFVLGCCWGVGHSAGMVVTFIFCVGLGTTVNTAIWEKIGNYCAGVLLISVGLYFLMFEESYLEKKQDGNYAATPCSCSSHGAPDEERLESQSGPADWNEPIAGTCEEGAPLLRPRASSHTREVRGTMLGFLHGMCCPSCLLSISFAGRITTDTYSASIIASFVTVFVFASALGTGAFAVAWTLLTTQGTRSFLSPIMVYRGSCGLCLSVGVFWIVANYAGKIGFLDFADHAFSN